MHQALHLQFRHHFVCYGKVDEAMSSGLRDEFALKPPSHAHCTHAHS